MVIVFRILYLKISWYVRDFKLKESESIVEERKLLSHFLLYLPEAERNTILSEDT